MTKHMVGDIWYCSCGQRSGIRSARIWVCLFVCLSWGSLVWAPSTHGISLLIFPSAHDDAIWTAAWGKSEADGSETIITGSLDDLVKVWKWCEFLHLFRHWWFSFILLSVVSLRPSFLSFFPFFFSASLQSFPHSMLCHLPSYLQCWSDLSVIFLLDASIAAVPVTLEKDLS